MLDSFEHHPFNAHMTIDFSGKVPMYSLAIPFDNMTATKTIASVASTDWHGAWTQAKDVVVDFMNNLYTDTNDDHLAKLSIAPRLVQMRSEFSNVGNVVKGTDPLFRSYDEGLGAMAISDCIELGFEPIRICRVDDESIYYELNGIAAFFYCEVECCGRTIVCWLGRADFMDWEAARRAKEKLIFYFSLYYKEVFAEYFIDKLEGDFVDLNHGDYTVFMYEAAERHSLNMAIREDLMQQLTGVC